MALTAEILKKFTTSDVAIGKLQHASKDTRLQDIGITTLHIKLSSVKGAGKISEYGFVPFVPETIGHPQPKKVRVGFNVVSGGRYSYVRLSSLPADLTVKQLEDLLKEASVMEVSPEPLKDMPRRDPDGLVLSKRPPY
jgi:hypothetical protein